MSVPRICVAVRKKPCGDADKDIVTVGPTGKECIVNEPKIKFDLTPYTDRHTFVYDQVMPEHMNNREVYQMCCQPLIDTLFSRGNATCFAYGQTGSGKTHTMLGRDSEPGLYACAAKDVFSRAKAIQAEVYASFYEIYGRKLFDLLNDRAKLVAREDAKKEVVICGLSEHPVSGVEDLFGLITAGSASRAAGTTSANADSSRSHAVLQMEVREKGNGKTIGRISFIDLAGNERGADTFDCDRKTRMEGAEINKSLLALKECIRALGMGKSHVPFRGSILTEVLRDSFLGNSRTTMIATISPADRHCENTLNTLRYTQRVKDFIGTSGGATKEQIIDKEPLRRAAPVVKAGRRVVSDVKRPEWVDDFTENSGIGEPPAVAALPRGGGGVARGGGGGGARADAKRIVVRDPRIKTIVEQHINNIDDDELAAEEEDDDEEANVPEAKEARQVRAVHAHVVREITKAEEAIMQVHRDHIDQKMSGIKEEIKAIQALDDKDGVDEYVLKVKDILSRQRRQIDDIMSKISGLQTMLKDEDDLARTFTPQSKPKGQGRPNYGR